MRMIMLAVALLAAAPAYAQGGDVTPTCRPNARGAVDYRACAAAAPAGSPERVLALINLASEAFMDRNFPEAVRLYDEAIPPGKQVYSDVYFHAFRGSAYDHVGRDADGYRDARIALDMLTGKRATPGMRITPASAAPAYDLILPILRKNGDADFAAALSAYRAIPPDGWAGWTNRASVLNDLGERDAALTASEEALKLNSTHPGVLNNHCYILTMKGDAAAALPYCDRAVAAAPDEGAVHHSRATALAAAGRCADAEAALATARRLDPSSATYRETLACKAP
jgi:Flp pilus assembly protein TadD